MNRGDLITVVVARDHGKPRPAVVVQADVVQTGTIMACLLTGDVDQVAPYRLRLEADDQNGLKQPSLVQADKIYPVPLGKCGPVIGRLSAQDMATLNLHLTFVLGLGD